MESVVQWNIGDFRSNFEELKLLLNRSQSAIVALQECRLGEGQLPPRGYTLLLPQGIQGNENVDKLAKEALNRASCSGKLFCWSELKPKINAYIHSIWQKNWDAEGANKLHEVLPNLGEDLHRRGEGDGRKRETVMCRLRVDHTWLTQSYLLKNEEQPFCYACDSLYTVRHILIECPDFQITRRKYFSVTDLYRFFREVHPSRVVGYLKEFGVYRNI
ncbi:ribonuclease hi [Plakobranchus ocellatus]|uniref:Ribonuclease hi n=1 Tax=Plakobranchus ocellatus TaxID=259542 RepID=A0AAV3Z5R3_9GAST|nr:ribonuclease hi [Plakobranchus ocellatus]